MAICPICGYKMDHFAIKCIRCMGLGEKTITRFVTAAKPPMPQPIVMQAKLGSGIPIEIAQSSSGKTTNVGYVNRNGQENLGCTGEPGTDHCQKVYILRCRKCGTEYGANGSDIFQRKCPHCQSGRPGI